MTTKKLLRVWVGVVPDTDTLLYLSARPTKKECQYDIHHNHTDAIAKVVKPVLFTAELPKKRRKR